MATVVTLTAWKFLVRLEPWCLRMAYVLRANSEVPSFTWLLPIIPCLALVIGILMIVVPIFLDSVPFQKFKARITGNCYHDWKEVEIVKWEPCTICRIELHEPNNFHPLVKYRCLKCGVEQEDIDSDRTKTLQGEVSLQDMES